MRPQAAKDLYFDESIKNIKENQPGRVGLFVNVDFNSVDVENHVEDQVNIIRDAVSKGAIGLKVYKSLSALFLFHHQKECLYFVILFRRFSLLPQPVVELVVIFDLPTR